MQSKSSSYDTLQQQRVLILTVQSVPLSWNSMGYVDLRLHLPHHARCSVGSFQVGSDAESKESVQDYVRIGM